MIPTWIAVVAMMLLALRCSIDALKQITVFDALLCAAGAIGWFITAIVAMINGVG